MLAEIPRSTGYLLLCKYPTPLPKPKKIINKNLQPIHITNTNNITIPIIHNLYNHNTLFNYLSFPYPLSIYLNPKIATHISKLILSYSYYTQTTISSTRKPHHKNFLAIGFRAITMSPQGPKIYTIRQSQSPKSSTQ